MPGRSVFASPWYQTTPRIGARTSGATMPLYNSPGAIPNIDFRRSPGANSARLLSEIHASHVVPPNEQSMTPTGTPSSARSANSFAAKQ